MSDRRQEITDVAKDLFARRGVQQTTVRDIGRGAGILSGSLYYHFDSKLDIVDAILQEFCGEVLSAYRGIARLKVDSSEAFRLMARYAFSLIHDHHDAMIMIQDDYVDPTRDAETKDPRFAYLVDFNNEVEKRWLDVIRKGVKAGEFNSDVEPRLVYRFTRDAILGAIRWYSPEGGRTTEDLADTLVDALLFGIAAGESR